MGVSTGRRCHRSHIRSVAVATPCARAQKSGQHVAAVLRGAKTKRMSEGACACNRTVDNFILLTELQTMMNILFYGAVLVLLGMATGCSSSGDTVKTTTYPPPPADFHIDLIRSVGGDIRVELTIAGTGTDTGAAVSFVRNIREVRTLLYHPDRGLLDTVNHTLASSSVENDTAKTMALEAMSRWTNALGVPFDSIYTQTLITVRGGRVYAAEQGFSLPPLTENQHSLHALELKGWVEDSTDSSALFVVLAERKRMINGEYFPSSERLRVMITSESGTAVWNSSQAQIFMQMTAFVEPKNIGEVRRYELPWNGMDAQGKPLPPGKYNVVLTLPARPSPYSVVIPFSWKVPHDK